MPSFSRSDLSWLIDLTTLIAVIVGLTFAALELRQLSAAQESQNLLQLYQITRSDEFVAGTDIVRLLPDELSASELRATLSEDEMRLIEHLHLTFEALGVMVYRHDVSLAWVDELFRFSVLQTWEKMESLTLDIRETTGYSGWNEWHQWLAERLLEKSQEQPIPAYEAYSDWTP
jgi:hypothetical protein